MYSEIDSNKRKTNLLILIFVVFVIAIGWAFNEFMGYGYGAVVFAMIIAITMSLTGYYKGDKIALKSTKAKQIEKKDHPKLWRLVENLSITAGIPMPKIHIINSNALNAFATGRDPEHASIAVTQGLLNSLEKQELEGVIAHELSHIRNFDIRLMTIVVVLVGTIALLADYTFRMRIYGGRSRKGNTSGIIALVGLALLILSPIISELIKLAISRKREFLADASGSLLTRYPEGLASALEKISNSKIGLETASTATAHLFISNPIKKKTFVNMFSTHPPAHERIKRLRTMT